MFNMKRVLLLAGMHLGLPEAIRFIAPQMPAMTPPPGRHRGIGARGSKDRLHLDRSSSVKKLQRWLNDGDIEVAGPDEKAKLRHAWYRREKAWEAYRAGLPAANVHPDYHTDAQRGQLKAENGLVS